MDKSNPSVQRILIKRSPMYLLSFFVMGLFIPSSALGQTNQTSTQINGQTNRQTTKQTAEQPVGQTPDHIHKLTCKKLDYLFGFRPGFTKTVDPNLRLICIEAVRVCHAQDEVFREKKSSALRQEVESWLLEKIRMELDLCEISISHYNPDYLDVAVP